jgi:hypothetical protein
LAEYAPDGDLATMALHDTFRDRQSKTSPSAIGDALLPELIEDVRHVIGRYPRARIAHLKPDRLPIAVDREAHNTARRRELDRILQKIPEGLLHAIFVGNHQRKARRDVGVERE